MRSSVIAFYFIKADHVHIKVSIISTLIKTFVVIIKIIIIAFIHINISIISTLIITIVVIIKFIIIAMRIIYFLKIAHMVPPSSSITINNLLNFDSY